MQLSHLPTPEFSNCPSEDEATQQLFDAWRKGNLMVPQKYLGSVSILVAVTDLIVQGYDLNELQKLFMRRLGSDEGVLESRDIMEKVHKVYGIKRRVTHEELNNTQRHFWRNVRAILAESYDTMSSHHTAPLETSGYHYDLELMQKLNQAFVLVLETFQSEVVSRALKEYRERFLNHPVNEPSMASRKFNEVMTAQKIDLRELITKRLLDAGFTDREARLLGDPFTA